MRPHLRLPQMLPLLEHLERLHLWLDDDVPGREGVERLTQKLGLGRCFVVQPAPRLLRRVAPPAAPAAVAAAAATTVTGSSPAGDAGPAAPAASSETPPSPKDANEALLLGLDLATIITGAAVRRHDQILTFDDLRPAVMREVAASLGFGGDARSDGGRAPHGGVPLRSLPRLNRLLKGHRSGELTIITGGTGR